jgi:hypothetical protein
MWDSGLTADGWIRARSGAAACRGDGGCCDLGIRGIRMGEARLVLSMGRQGRCGRGTGRVEQQRHEEGGQWAVRTWLHGNGGACGEGVDELIFPTG